MAGVELAENNKLTPVARGILKGRGISGSFERVSFEKTFTLAADAPSQKVRAAKTITTPPRNQ